MLAAQKALFFLLLLVVAMPPGKAQADSWVIQAQSSDAEGDQFPFPANYDVLGSRVETNGTALAFVLVLKEASEASQRAIYQLSMKTAEYEHTVYCFVGERNPVETGPLDCRAQRRVPPMVASTPQTESYAVVGSIDELGDTLRIEVQFTDFPERHGSEVELVAWFADSMAGTSVWPADVTTGRADTHVVGTSFSVPPVVSQDPPEHADVVTLRETPGFSSAMTLLVITLFLAKRATA